MNLKQLAGWAVGLVLAVQPLGSCAGEPAKVTLSGDSAHVKMLEARVNIDAPPAAVWEVITNYGNLKNILPGYEKSQVVADGPDSATVDMAIKASSLIPAFKYRLHMTENKPAGTVTIKRVSGDFDSILASYKVIPAKGGTKTTLVYHLNIDLGKKGLPGSGGVLKSSTEKTMNAMQRACNDSYRRSLTAQR